MKTDSYRSNSYAEGLKNEILLTAGAETFDVIEKCMGDRNFAYKIADIKIIKANPNLFLRLYTDSFGL